MADELKQRSEIQENPMKSLRACEMYAETCRARLLATEAHRGEAVRVAATAESAVNQRENELAEAEAAKRYCLDQLREQ
eukprot:6654595-Alexandrium_andersonii.AAC.1